LVFYSTVKIEKEISEAVKSKNPISILLELGRSHQADFHFGKNPITEITKKAKKGCPEKVKKREAKE